MPLPQVDLIRQFHDAFRARDLPTITRLVSSEFRMWQTPELPWGGEYHDHDGLRQFFVNLTGYVDSNVVVEQLIDAGNHVVAMGRTQGTVVGTGQPFDVPIAHVWRRGTGRWSGSGRTWSCRLSGRFLRAEPLRNRGRGQARGRW